MAKKRGFTPSVTEQLALFVKGVDNAFAKYILLTQDKLSAASPVDTGRLASSWRVAKNKVDGSVEPVRDERGSTSSAPYSGKITFDGTWYITNSLPYAERAGLGAGGQGPYNGRRGQTNWYKNITAHTKEDWLKQLRKSGRNGGLGFPAPNNFRPS